MTELYAKKFPTLRFGVEWRLCLGEEVESTGVWMVWGSSGNGKTRFMLKLAKELCKLGLRVIYNTLEEGSSLSIQRAVKEESMIEVKDSFFILPAEPMNVLKERLHKRRSPDVVMIDSLQHSGINKKEFIALKNEFPNKLFIWISHAEGKQPEGRLGKFVKYDAMVKIHVEGYRAHFISRYGGSGYYTIWEKGAAEYWGQKSV